MEDGGWFNGKDARVRPWGDLRLPERQTRRAAFVKWVARALGVGATVEGEWVDGRHIRFRQAIAEIEALPPKDPRRW